jgi:hypothetical protein
MIDWILERILIILNYMPELFVAEGDPRFDVIRWWLGFVLIVLIVSAIVMLRPVFSAIATRANKAFRGIKSDPKI